MIGNSGRIDFSVVFYFLLVYRAIQDEPETKTANWYKREGEGVLFFFI